MEIKNIAGLVAGIIIAVVMFAAILVPVLNAATETVGPEATVDNTVRGTYEYNIWKGEDITFQLTRNPTTYTVDGTAVTLVSVQNMLIASNIFSLRTGGTVDNPDINLQYVGLTSGNGKTFTFAIVDGEYTLTISPGLSDETVLTGTLDWMVYAVPAGEEGNSGLGQVTTPTSPFYTSNTNKIVVLGNIYTTGDNDTYYAYYNGDLTVNEEYADVSSVSISQTLTDGYTNIYDTAVTVTIGDESFTPFFILAPLTVNGNEAGGTMYDLLSIIPLLVAVGIVIGVLGVLFVRRE